MNRRTFARTAAAASLAVPGAAAPARNSYFELRVIRLRNGADNQRQRTTEFLQKHGLPAMERAGVKKAGVFSSLIAPGGPFLMTVASFPSLAAYEAARDKVTADADYLKARQAFDSQPGLNYVRVEVSLLRAFDSIPDIEAPPVEGRKGSRVFELRTYESNNSTTLARKIKMFDEGEIAIFRKTGLVPVFFGQTIFGRNMPNLVYMVAFDDLAAREKNWRGFGGDPDWQKLRSQPGYADAEIVSNIGNVLLSALPFSAIR
jgi:hypothetical protein